MCLNKLKANLPVSILPPDMEAARLKLAKIHTRFLLSGLAIAAFTVPAAMTVANYFSESNQYALAAAGRVFVFGIPICLFLCLFNSPRFMKKRSRDLGYICPHCHAPLYQFMSRGFHVEITGRCPKCKEIVSDQLADRACSVDAMTKIITRNSADDISKKQLWFVFVPGLVIPFIIVCIFFKNEFVREHLLLFLFLLFMSSSFLQLIIAGVLEKISKKK